MPVKKKKTKKMMIAEIAPKPPIEEGSFSVVLSVEDMFSLVQILSISKSIFEKTGEACLKDGDEKSAQVFYARAKLSLLLYDKFKTVAGIGEPTSREVH